MFTFKIAVAITTAVFFVSACTDVPQPHRKNGCADSNCLPAIEEPPGSVSQVDESSVSSEECLWCLGAASEACIEENEDCLSSFSCRAWKECTETCAVTSPQESCYHSCDSSVKEFFTPLKMKTCNCDVCYAQCFNMCAE